MITYLKNKNHKSIKIPEKNETLTTILKSFDALVIFATTSSSNLTVCYRNQFDTHNDIEWYSMWINE